MAGASRSRPSGHSLGARFLRKLWSLILFLTHVHNVYKNFDCKLGMEQTQTTTYLDWTRNFAGLHKGTNGVLCVKFDYLSQWIYYNEQVAYLIPSHGYNRVNFALLTDAHLAA